MFFIKNLQAHKAKLIEKALMDCQKALGIKQHPWKIISDENYDREQKKKDIPDYSKTDYVCNTKGFQIHPYARDPRDYPPQPIIYLELEDFIKALIRRQVDLAALEYATYSAKAQGL